MKGGRRGFLLGMLLLLAGGGAQAQETGQLSGDFLMSASFYDRDEKIGTNTTQYLRELSSAEAWMYLSYRYQGWRFAVRYDLYHNSPLINPVEAYSAQGIGYFQLQKDIGDLQVTAGHFYDQIGSGLIYRSYEERLIGLDYATRGVHLSYRPVDNLHLKAFTGQQKNRFDVYAPIIKGASADYFLRVGKHLSLSPGAGVVNRTLDRPTVELMADEINTYPLQERFVPMTNMYAWSVWNRFNYKGFGLYLEYADKSEEAVLGQTGLLEPHSGNVIYASGNYSTKGLGISAQYKRSQYFGLRTSPYLILLQGVMNYVPALTKQHSYRLPARYNISALDFGEEGYQFEVTWTPKSGHTLFGNVSRVEGNENELLFQEFFLDYHRRFSRNTKAHFGLQALDYNQEVYETKPQAPLVRTFTPYVELIQRLDRRKSVRVELQYLFTQRNARANRILNGLFNTDYNTEAQPQDLGDFAFVLLEFNVAPHWSFSVSDMINTVPAKNDEEIHYYSIFGSYIHNQTRYSLSYVKQVEGVVCTGGVCRVEPAFSGLRFGLSTNF